MKPPTVLALLLALAPLAGGEEPAAPDGARAVLVAAVESMGGEEALAGIRGLRHTVRGLYRSGSMESPYTAEMVWRRPDDLRWSLKATGFAGEMGIDAGRPWSAFMAPAAHLRGPGAAGMNEWLLVMDVLLVRPLLHRGDAKLSLGDAAEGKAVVVVEFEGLGAWRMTFATADGAVRLEVLHGMVTQPDGRKGRMEVEYSKHQAFDGITLPARVVSRTYAGDALRETMEETLESLEWNPEVGEGFFAMPDPGVKVDVPEVKDLPPVTGLVFLHRGSYDRLGETIRGAIATAGELGLPVAGGVAAVFADDPAAAEDPAGLRTEVFVPVYLAGPAPDLPEGVSLREVPARKVAAMSVRGEYGTVEAAAIPKLAAWMAEHGHAGAGAPEAVYLHDPASTVPEDQIAEIRIPVGE